MSASLFYVNSDKRQFFYSGLFGRASSAKSLGCGPGGRALGILLSHGGSWRGDRISVFSDSCDDYITLASTFEDVEVEAELMLIEFDGFKWFETELVKNIVAFIRACDYAIYLRRQDIGDLLDKTFGRGHWQRRYDKHMKTTNVWNQKVAEAANRELRRLWNRPD